MILFVDDEKVISEVTVSSLKKENYDVASFNLPLDALDYFKENHKKINLAIVDNRMPEMNGAQLAREFRDIFPNLPIILTTGFEDEDVTDVLREYHDIYILKKPFRFKYLKHLIQDIFKN